MLKWMLIGELADAVGLPTQTVRFYERRGLLPKPDRASNGYRVYEESTVARLRFVRLAQQSSLTLAEIAGIINIRDNGASPCGHVEELLVSKLADVRIQKRRLQALEHELNQLLERSHLLDPAECGETDICQILSSAPADQA